MGEQSDGSGVCVSRKLSPVLQRALPHSYTDNRVTVQPAPKRVTGCGQAFPLQMDNRKKAANLTLGRAGAVMSGLGENADIKLWSSQEGGQGK